MVKKSRKIYFLGSAIIALATLFLVYFLLIVTGVVQVKNEIITISSGSIEATYNGEPVKCEEVEVTQGELRKGHTIEAIYTGKVVNVGSAANTYTFRIIDSEGVDVTDKYTITKLEGTITVNKRPISLRASDAYKEYDGTPLISNSKEYTWVNGSLIDGHTIEVSSYGERTEAGIGENQLDVQIYDANGNLMTQNYDIQVVPGALTVNPVPIVVSSGSANKRYDGSPLTESFWQLEHGKLLDLDNDGEADHKIEAETCGTVTEPGKVDNTFKYIRVIDIKTGEDVTHNYDIDPQHGTLEIKAVSLVFKSKDIYKYYDGKPLTPNKDDVELFSGTLFEGHYFEVVMEELTEVNAGKYDYKFNIIIKNQEGDIITDNYDWEPQYGTAEIRPADLSIKTGTKSSEYNGQELYCKDYEIISNDFKNGAFNEDGNYVLENGDTLIIVDYTKAINVTYDKLNKVQGVDNVITFKVVSKDGVDVTKNYNIKDTMVCGVLTISQKTIKVFTPDVIEKYAGQNVKCDSSKINEVVVKTDELYTGLIEGDKLMCSGFSSELTPKAGLSILNVPIVKIVNEKGDDITGNYVISPEEYGKLSYEKITIMVESHSSDKEYDGQKLTCYAYDINIGGSKYEVIYENGDYKYYLIKEDGQKEMKDSFMEGHSIEFINNSYRIDGGKTTNKFSFKVYISIEENNQKKKIEVSDIFDKTTYFGELLVNKQVLYVHTANENFIYNGDYQYCDDFEFVDYNGFPMLIDENQLGIDIVTTDSTVVKNVTSDSGVNNEIDFEVYTKGTDSISPNYTIQIKKYGKLVVSKYTLILETENEYFVYDDNNPDTVFTSETKTLAIYDPNFGSQPIAILDSNSTNCDISSTGDIFSIGDRWSSISKSLGEVINEPLEISIKNFMDTEVSNNYSFVKNYGKLVVTNPNYDGTVSPSKIAIPYSVTQGDVVDMNYAIQAGVVSKDAIIDIPDGYTCTYKIEGSASTPGVHKDALKIVDFKLYSINDLNTPVNINGAGHRIKLMTSDIVIYEHTVTLTTESASKVYDGEEFNGKDFNVTVSGLAAGHRYEVVESSYTKVKRYGNTKNEVSIIIYDENNKNVTGEYYIDQHFGMFKISKRDVYLTFDDPFVEKQLFIINTKGVSATQDDFDPESYQLIDIVDGHKIVSFSTDNVLETGQYEITKFKIVDQEGKDVTNNYNISSDEIFIFIEYVGLETN